MMSLTLCFRPHYAPGVHSASNRNEYQEYFLGGGGGGRGGGLTTLPPSCAGCLEILELQRPGTLRICTGIALPFYWLWMTWEVSTATSQTEHHHFCRKHLQSEIKEKIIWSPCYSVNSTVFARRVTRSKPDWRPLTAVTDRQSTGALSSTLHHLQTVSVFSVFSTSEYIYSTRGVQVTPGLLSL
jgi:hypothetical protein